MAKFFRGKKSTVKITGDATQAIKKVQEVVSTVKKDSREITVSIIPDVVAVISKYTPPCYGKNTIEKRLYTRPVIFLPLLARGKVDGQRANSQDYAQLRDGKLYKILYTKRGMKKGQAFAYAKTKSQAKALSKIQNRGISRVMWGKSLPDIGAKIPNTIVRLMNKSPNMTSKSLSKSILQTSNNLSNVSLTIENRVQNISNYGKEALNHGYKKFHSLFSRRMKQKMDEATK